MTEQAVVVSPPKQKLVEKFADRMGVESNALLGILKKTCFKTEKEISNEQMAALLIVADAYDLNPFTKEIYAYPDKHNGIVPVVGVDGWSRIINSHPNLNGIEFRYSENTAEHKGKVVYEWIECVIHRKDRDQATVVREYFDEVVRSVSFATPWDSHPKRMHRHKTLIQGARLAFGFAGIYDEDEAERIKEAQVASLTVDTSRHGGAQATLDALNAVNTPTTTSVIEGEIIEHEEENPVDSAETQQVSETPEETKNQPLESAPKCLICDGKGMVETPDGKEPCECNAAKK